MDCIYFEYNVSKLCGNCGEACEIAVTQGVLSKNGERFFLTGVVRCDKITE